MNMDAIVLGLLFVSLLLFLPSSLLNKYFKSIGVLYYLIITAIYLDKYRTFEALLASKKDYSVKSSFNSTFLTSFTLPIGCLIIYFVATKLFSKKTTPFQRWLVMATIVYLAFTLFPCAILFGATYDMMP